MFDDELNALLFDREYGRPENEATPCLAVLDPSVNMILLFAMRLYRRAIGSMNDEWSDEQLKAVKRIHRVTGHIIAHLEQEATREVDITMLLIPPEGSNEDQAE